MKIGSNGYENASEVAKNKAMMHDESGKIGKGEFLNKEQDLDIKEKTELDSNVQSVETPAAVIDSSSKEEQDMALFKADVTDEIIAMENNFKLSEEEKLPSDEVASAATQNIQDVAKDDINKLNLAIEVLQKSMEGNPEDANKAKQQVIDLLKEKISSLEE